MEYRNLLLDVSERIATITFNRPKTLNALNRDTVLELKAALSVAAPSGAGPAKPPH